MGIIRKKQLTLFSVAFFCCLSAVINGQNAEENILNSYKNFSASTKEVAYVHINKSTFVKNEMLGFTAYIIDKLKKQSLPLTTNLYCTITTDENEVIKKKLVKVTNGIAHNTFEIDSLFTSGVYTFKAYTNWMLNFNEHNYFEHPFLVVSPAYAARETKKKTVEEYDVKMLPEGGHLVYGVRNNIGIIIKNQKGIGLKNAKGRLVDDKNHLLTEFTLNQFGIAKVPIIPELTKKYRVIINHNNEIISASIKNIEKTGIAFSLTNIRGKVGVSLKTNPETKKLIKGKKFILAIHNGVDIKLVPFVFEEKLEVSKIIKPEDLYTGINIFTVFDAEEKTPILERVFFNYAGISKANIQNVKTTLENDSIKVKLKLNTAIAIDKTQNLSISILPKESLSYSFNSSILSKTYLEPYVRGFIQNASYYFSNQTAKTKYDLDNLLLTQGWSAYEWKDIFVAKPYAYKFEQGINLVATINNKVKEGFLAYPLKNNKTQIFKPTKEDKAFIQTNLFPEDNETYRVGLLKKNNVTVKPKLTLEFYPSQVPALTINSYQVPLITNLSSSIEGNAIYMDKNTSSDTEVLDEVIITSSAEATRIEKIKRNSFGNVYFFKDEDSRGGQTLASYLSTRGFTTSDFNGVLSITNPNPNSPNNTTPLVILDDIPLNDFGFLANFSMNIVDYIEVNKSGIGYGIRGGGGVIKIMTDPIKRNQYNSRLKNDFASYTFPITFNAPKKYYTPIYQNLNSKFFKEYGVISWIPRLKFDSEGALMFKISNTFTSSITLHIEGLTNNNVFISESKTIYPLD